MRRALNGMAAVLLLAVVAACHGGSSTASSTTGASSPRAAIEAFMGAVRGQNLQAMAEVWGNQKGPARDQMERSEFEKRALLMQCYLKHDNYSVLGELPDKEGGRTYNVRISRGKIQRELSFATIKGPLDRWYVLNADLAKVQDMCTEIGKPG